MSVSVDPGRVSRKIMVLGLGNPDRGDDGIGVRVARQLAGRLSPDVELLTCQSDMLSLIEDWAGIDALVCIDATTTMGTPGRVHRIDLATGELPLDIISTSSHALGLGEAIHLARALQRAPRHIVVYAIEGSCFDRGAPLSAAVTAAAEEVVDQVVADVDRLRRI